MKIFTTAAFLSLLTVASPFIGAGHLSAQSINLPEIVKDGERGQTPIEVTSADANLQGLLRRAFNLHGAFHVVSSGRVGYSFRFSPVSSNTVSAEILVDGQSRFKQNVTGKDQRDAALRAADLVIQKTTGKRGFFAGRLAFVSNRSGNMELFSSDLLMEQVSQLTRDRNKVLSPNWSPDGTKIIYTTYHASGFPDLYQVDLTSGRRSAFASFRGTNTGGVFNPRGDRVAVIMSGSGNAELYTMNSNGRDIRRLTRSSGLESDPSWSPDGNQIVYASDSAGKPQLYVIGANGGAARRLQTNISGYCAEPRWNPVDSSKIVFTIAQGGKFELALWDFKTNKSRVLTKGSGDSMEPEWLNDGRHVIFTQRNGSNRRLSIIDTETGKTSQLSTSLGNAWQAGYVYPR